MLDISCEWSSTLGVLSRIALSLGLQILCTAKHVYSYRLPPLTNSLKRQQTLGIQPTPLQHQSRHAGVTNDVNNSCSIPLRHTTAGMMVTTFTPRDGNNSVNKSSSHVAVSHASHVTQPPQTTSQPSRQKTIISFPKVFYVAALRVGCFTAAVVILFDLSFYSIDSDDCSSHSAKHSLNSGHYSVP